MSGPAASERPAGTGSGHERPQGTAACRLGQVPRGLCEGLRPTVRTGTGERGVRPRPAEDAPTSSLETNTNVPSRAAAGTANSSAVAFRTLRTPELVSPCHIKEESSCGTSVSETQCRIRCLMKTVKTPLPPPHPRLVRPCSPRQGTSTYGDRPARTQLSPDKAPFPTGPAISRAVPAAARGRNEESDQHPRLALRARHRPSHGPRWRPWCPPHPHPVPGHRQAGSSPEAERLREAFSEPSVTRTTGQRSPCGLGPWHPGHWATKGDLSPSAELS